MFLCVCVAFVFLYSCRRLNFGGALIRWNSCVLETQRMWCGPRVMLLIVSTKVILVNAQKVILL